MCARIELRHFANVEHTSWFPRRSVEFTRTLRIRMLLEGTASLSRVHLHRRIQSMRRPYPRFHPINLESTLRGLIDANKTRCNWDLLLIVFFSVSSGSPNYYLGVSTHFATEVQHSGWSALQTRGFDVVGTKRLSRFDNQL